MALVGESTGVLTPAHIAVAEDTRQAESFGTELLVTELPGVSALWRASMHTLGAHSAPILVCALVGLVGAQLLGALVSAAMTFDVYFRSGGVYATSTNTFYVQLLIQACLGTFAIAWARGAISWMALCHTMGRTVTFQDALRRSVSRWPALLVSSLAYGALATLGIAGMTLLLRQLRLDLTSIGRVAIDFDSIARVVGIRMINGFVPDPGSPFTELVSYARYLLRRSSTNYYWLYIYQQNISDVPIRLWLIGISSLAPWVAGGTLLRLRAPAIMDAPQPNQLSALYAAIQLGTRHFGYLFRHGALLWLAGSALTILFVSVPQVLSQYLLVPELARSMNNLWPYPVSTLLYALGAVLVGMVLTAFISVYDAHLYRAVSLKPSRPERDTTSTLRSV